MPDHQRVLAVFEPIAARLLAADARAIAELRGLSFLPGCDGHPRDTTLAWGRRAAVATELAQIARAAPEWRDHGDTRRQGSYEFTVGDDLAVRLAIDIDATPGPPATSSLFSTQNLSRHGRDRVLVRLRGDALNAPIMDVAFVVGANHIDGHLLMTQIAKRSTTLVPTPQAVTPPKARITLPKSRRQQGASDIAGA